MPHPFSQAVPFTSKCPLLPSIIAMHFASEASKYAKLDEVEPPKHAYFACRTFKAQNKWRTDEIDLVRDSVVDINDLIQRLPNDACTSNG
jgi:uncharacterized protein YkuJ